MKSIQEVSKQTLLIQNYLMDYPKDQKLTYSDLEIATGVKMDNQGKQFLRSALKRMKMPYVCIKGEGIEFTNTKTALSIAAHDAKGLLVKIKGARKRVTQVLSICGDQLPDVDRSKLQYTGATYGSLELSAKQSTMVYGKPQLIAGSTVK